VLVVTALHAPSNAAEPPITLYCARDVPGFPDAEIRLNVHGSHVVNVIFMGVRPSRAQADRALRDCLNTAIKLDGSRDILTSLWHRDRERGSSSGDELLQPYGPLTNLVYKASSKTVVLQKLKPVR
jgi:hypothetical protein